MAKESTRAHSVVLEQGMRVKDHLTYGTDVYTKRWKSEIILAYIYLSCHANTAVNEAFAHSQCMYTTLIQRTNEPGYYTMGEYK